MEQIRKQGIFSRIKNSIKEFVSSDEEETMDDSFSVEAFKDEDADTLKLLQEQSSKIDKKAKTMFEDKVEKEKGLKNSIIAKISKVEVKEKKEKSIEDREIDD